MFRTTLSLQALEAREVPALLPLSPVVLDGLRAFGERVSAALATRVVTTSTVQTVAQVRPPLVASVPYALHLAAPAGLTEPVVTLTGPYVG